MAKWSRSASRTTGAKNAAGSCVITSVFVCWGVGGPELLVRDGGVGEEGPGGVKDMVRSEQYAKG